MHLRFFKATVAVITSSPIHKVAFRQVSDTLTIREVSGLRVKRSSFDCLRF